MHVSERQNKLLEKGYDLKYDFNEKIIKITKINNQLLCNIRLFLNACQSLVLFYGICIVLMIFQ